VCGLAVTGEQGVQKGSEHIPLWGLRVLDQHGGGVVAYRQYLALARQEVQDLVARGGVQIRALSLVMSLEGNMVWKAEL
jgi:hypothetical protein